MKLNHLDHLPKMVNKFEQERGHELGVNRNLDPPTNGSNADEDINF